jgi:hypothetical protein
MEKAQASRSGICLRDSSAPAPVLTIHRSGFSAISFFEQNRTTGRPDNKKQMNWNGWEGDGHAVMNVLSWHFTKKSGEE